MAQLATIAGVLALSLTGCNTMQGVGRDLQHVGQALENTAHRYSWGPPPATPADRYDGRRAQRSDQLANRR